MLLRLIQLMLVSFLACESTALAAAPASAPKVPVSDVKAMLPVKDINHGNQVLSKLAASDATESQKAEVLKAVYDSQNNAKNDSEKDPPGLPMPHRDLQLNCLARLGELPTDAVAPQLRAIVKEYQEHMASQKDRFAPRSCLQTTMAVLIGAHLADAEVRASARTYLKTGILEEATKGRIAGSLLQYDVSQISDADDADLSKRMKLILDSALLPTLGEEAVAPARVQRCAGVLAGLIAAQPEKAGKIFMNSALDDQSKYFLAFTGFNSALRKLVHKMPLSSTDYELVRASERWEDELAPKISRVNGHSRILEDQRKLWNERKPAASSMPRGS